MKHSDWFKWRKSWLFLSLLAVSANPHELGSPHILFIMVDDMGWNDVSFHGSDQIVTPNIDALAYQGVILQQYYSEAVCTPARTALLTGKYPMRMGMHGVPLYNAEDRGIPLSERLLPSYLKDLGYSTHLVGKWHVGMSRNEFLPTRRGYDTHYGMRGGFIDYYTYNKIETLPDGSHMFGLDLFDGMQPQNQEQRYIVDALTDKAVAIIHNHNKTTPLFLHVTHNAPHAGNAGAPLQPPPYTTLRNKHIAHSDRRLFADVVTHLDQSIGRLVRALDDQNMLHDTIIVFVSDNGAPTTGEFANRGVNLPYRGIKNTPWEGAVRVPAFIWHSSVRPRVWNGLMHITDWLPTLTAAAGGKINENIDGVSQWEVIVQDGQSKRNEVLIAMGDTRDYAAYRIGDYKVVVGNVSGLPNGYYGENMMPLKSEPPEYFPQVLSSDVARVLEYLGVGFDVQEMTATRDAATMRQTDPVADPILCEPTLNRGCLFNVRQDPMERHDLWNVAQDIAVLLTSRLRALWNQQIFRTAADIYKEADPAFWGYTWTPWLDQRKDIFNDTNEIRALYDELPVISSKLKNMKITKAAAINCGVQTNIQNFLCLLRSVF